MKTCSSCKESKELICFSKNKLMPDGFSYVCKECCAEYKRKYYQANSEKIAEHRRKYYQANTEKILERNRKYQQANPEKIAECDRKYQRKCYQANPEKYAEKNRKNWQKQKQEQAANLFFQMAHFASEITKTTPPTP